MPENRMMLEQYKISDFVIWHREKTLELRPEFQRGLVWTPAARSYLVDTILNGYPIPKIYMRSRIDTETKQTVREVVDGQQRLNTILEFANGKMQVSMRSSKFFGLTYDKLSEEQKEGFLFYPLAVDQLVNADDATVLEVFARLNTYAASLSPPEKRHAKFQGEFKTVVREMAQKWDGVMGKVLSVRKRVRMANDSLMAEMFGIVMEGVKGGGEKEIDLLYKRQDADSASREVRENAINVVNSTLTFFHQNLEEPLANTPLVRARPHFSMLFAALAHCGHGIPKGKLEELPDSPKKFPENNVEDVVGKLRVLTHAIEEMPARDSDLYNFWLASSKTTVSISSRKVRFHACLEALNG